MTENLSNPHSPPSALDQSSPAFDAEDAAHQRPLKSVAVVAVLLGFAVVFMPLCGGYGTLVFVRTPLFSDLAAILCLLVSGFALIFASLFFWAGRRRRGFIAVSSAFACLVCAVIFNLAETGIGDQSRYGRFEYANAADIPNDWYIELPSSAKGITLFQDEMGHRARFTVATDDLTSWVERTRSLKPNLNLPEDDDEWTSQSTEQFSAKIFARRFSDTDWTYTPGMLELHVTRASDFGGYTIWHEPETDVTYLAASNH
ncbi:DUF308 domain-containing protein [Novipirellula sp. SH528]|uniref:DUF308 domain-containing protein n=1 Tax=Novipirellula sp. SH528 TaxID=3454466 RepID=UPI003F9ECD36